MLPLRILCLLGFHGLVKSAPVSITGTGAARIYLDDSEAGDADHLDASTLRTANIGAVLELKGSHFCLSLATDNWYNYCITGITVVSAKPAIDFFTLGP